MSPNVSNSIFIASYLFQILSALVFKLPPYLVFRAVFFHEFFKVTVQRAHFVNRVHSMIGRAYFPENDSAHELKKAKAGFSVGGAFKVAVRLRQNFVSRVFYGAVALNICVKKLVILRDKGYFTVKLGKRYFL